MRKTIIKVAIASVTIAIVANAIWFIMDRVTYRQRKALFEKYRNNKTMYAYHTYYGALNPVMYFKEKETYSIYKSYYDSMRLRKESAGLGFEPIRTFPYDCRLILLDPQIDSEFVEVLYFEDSVDYSYQRGFVLKALLHEYPPADSLLESRRKFYDSLIRK